jgi:hypothetical protein
MPIQLIDIPRAVADYLNNQVFTTVEDFDGEISKGEDRQGEVIVQNGDTTTALRLINLRLHLQIEPRPGGDPDPDDDPDAAENARKVARLIAPNDPSLECTDNEGNVIAGGDESKNGQLIIKYRDIRSTLEAGRSMFQLVSVHCKEHGDVNVTCHVHADVDLSSLFPNSRNHNGACELKVGF